MSLQRSTMCSKAIELYPWQRDAVSRLIPGKVLYGSVGSGKTLAALVYFKESFMPKGFQLLVITTAKKRDTGDWESEADSVGINYLIVDSWNNISKYENRINTFILFDEQRVVGYGSWSKSFIKMAKANPWLLLTGTPGDVWMDYVPIFIANGFYKNKTDFIKQHVEYDRFAKYPKIKAYHKEALLRKLRQNVLVSMDVKRETVRHRIGVRTTYDKRAYKKVTDDRWNVYKERPIETASEFTTTLRRVVASSRGRQDKAADIMQKVDRLIVFYNYNYELQILSQLAATTKKPVAQWNGHKHEEIPDSKKWIYLVQYTAGAEGWNCTSTDSMLFYSLNYSFKMMEQAEGRIDRINTKYHDLYYYILDSASTMDRSVVRAIKNKMRFNASAWGKSYVGE